jgi:hypothetical protein
MALKSPPSARPTAPSSPAEGTTARRSPLLRATDGVRRWRAENLPKGRPTAAAAGVTAAAISAVALLAGVPIGTATSSTTGMGEILAFERPPLGAREAPTTTTGVPAPSAVPARGSLPVGKGMWLWQPDKMEGGDVDRLVAKAVDVGLSHLYVRTGSSKSGFHGAEYMNALLPKAHAAGLRVYGWDFPYLHDVPSDVSRSLAAVLHTAPGGHRIDGFVADIETSSEGTNLSAAGANAYAAGLRAGVGDHYPLVVAVPRPSEAMLKRFPYAAVVEHFDAVAPMVYWLNRQPDTDAAPAVNFFMSNFGKPVIPVGQAYDGSPEGGRSGPPPADEIHRFLAASEKAGAVGASFWSWQHASDDVWAAIKESRRFEWAPAAPEELRPEQVRALQAQLTQLGFTTAATGEWTDYTTRALEAYQGALRLPVSGHLDEATVDAMLRPYLTHPVGKS